MLSTNEKIMRSSKRVGLALGIIIGINILQDFLPFSYGYAGALLVILLLLRWFYIARKIQKNPKLTELLDDEYMQHLNLRSYRFSYASLIVITILLLFFKDRFIISAEDSLKIILAALVSIPGIVFFILDREM